LKDGDLRRQQGKKGYERYLKYFTADRMAFQYAQLLHSLE
jgi:hypothetical protein